MNLATRIVAMISRRTEWAEGHVFAFSPEQFAVSDGIRTALVVAAIFAAEICFDYPNLAFGAIAAFWTSLCDPLGSNRRRFRTMATFAVMGCVAISLATYGAHWGLWGIAITLFSLTFLCLLTRTFAPSFGPMPAQAGFIAAIAVVVGLASPRTMSGAVTVGSCFLAGSALMIALALLPLRERRSGTGRLAVVAIFSRLDDMLDSLIELGSQPDPGNQRWARFDTVNRRAIRFSLERGRELVARSGDTDAKQKLLIDAASRIFSALIAIGHSRKASGLPFDPKTETVALHGLREALTTALLEMEHDGDGKAIGAAAAKLLELSVGRDELLFRALDRAGAALKEVSGRWNENTSAAAGGSPPNRSFKIPSTVLWHSLRTSLAVLVSYFAGVWLGLSLPYWGAIATLVVMQPLTGNTWLRVVERGVGSILGGFIAVVAIAIASNHTEMALMIVPLCAIVIALRLVNYGLFVIFLTPMFMLMTDYVQSVDDLIWERVLNEARGACIGIVAGLLLWPTRERHSVADSIAAAIAANLAFASSVSAGGLEPDDLDRMERDAGIASSRLETTYERLWLEGHGRLTDLPRLQSVIAALRAICGSAAVAKLLQPRDSGASGMARADEYRAISEELQGAVRTSSLASIGDHQSLAEDELEHWVQNLIMAVRAYADPRSQAAIQKLAQ